jgi:3-methyladenine DNA glycosylase AlkD
MLISMPVTAAEFVAELTALATQEQRAKYARFFPPAERRPGDDFVGVPMGAVFSLAKQSVMMPLDEIELLLESDIHEARVAAVKSMAVQYAARTATPEHRQALVDLYLRRHDRVDSWDLVDLGAPYIIGPHLKDGDRELLDRLAASGSPWERRTALYATLAFLRRGDANDAARLGEQLIHDPHESVRKAVGTILRSVGDVDLDRLRAILDRHAATMPRVTLRMATEKLERTERDRWLAVQRQVAAES